MVSYVQSQYLVLGYQSHFFYIKNRCDRVQWQTTRQIKHIIRKIYYIKPGICKRNTPVTQKSQKWFLIFE